jgi:hypothetical protein
MSLIALAKATEIAAALSSIALAKRRTEHVPAAVALVLLTLITLARGPLSHALSVASPPESILVFVDGAAELGTYATVAGLAVAVAVGAEHRRRTAAVAFAVWALASIALAAMYPSPLVTGRGLHRVYFAADLVGLFVSAAALAYWTARKLAAKRSPDSASIISFGLVTLDGAILLAPFSPWRGNLFGSSFDGICVIIIVFFAAFFAVQVNAWKLSRF